MTVTHSKKEEIVVSSLLLLGNTAALPSDNCLHCGVPGTKNALLRGAKTVQVLGFRPNRGVLAVFVSRGEIRF